MNISLLKFWHKITNKNKYYDYKFSLKKKENIKIFKEKYETQINNIQKIIKDKNELFFLHSGHAGDIINTLPVIKELSKTHKCNLIIQVNKPINSTYYKHPAGNVFINDRIFNLLLPLLQNQNYIYRIEKYKNQKIDINLDIVRELPVGINFDAPKWGFNLTGIQSDLTKPYLSVEPHKHIKDIISVSRSFRYRNYFINYKFLSDRKKLLFIGMKDEYEDLKKEIRNLEFYDCKDFLELASIIKSSNFFIGNQSFVWDVAEALKTPRLLEGCPYNPISKPHGINAYDCFYQIHFEKFFEILHKK